MKTVIKDFEELTKIIEGKDTYDEIKKIIKEHPELASVQINYSGVDLYTEKDIDDFAKEIPEKEIEIIRYNCFGYYIQYIYYNLYENDIYADIYDDETGEEIILNNVTLNDLKAYYEKQKNVFKLPVEYAVWGYVEVPANNLEDAIRYYQENQDNIPLPLNPEYIDGSDYLCGSNDCSTITDLVQYISTTYNIKSREEN